MENEKIHADILSLLKAKRWQKNLEGQLEFESEKYGIKIISKGVKFGRLFDYIESVIDDMEEDNFHYLKYPMTSAFKIEKTYSRLWGLFESYQICNLQFELPQYVTWREVEPEQMLTNCGQQRLWCHAEELLWDMIWRRKFGLTPGYQRIQDDN